MSGDDEILSIFVQLYVLSFVCLILLYCVLYYSILRIVTMTSSDHEVVLMKFYKNYDIFSKLCSEVYTLHEAHSYMYMYVHYILVDVY